MRARRQADQALAVPVEPVARLDPSGFDPSRELFECEEWSENPFHTIEVQACSKTQTIQFACGDYSGDYHGENPSGVALNLDDAETLACFVLDQISAIRALATEARRAETLGSVHEGAGRQATPNPSPGGGEAA